ncbi:hypothetical protein [Georgenia wangjunii]|uniref:hypothetical protein n=1 Tax=Georgenia wangjunii TaxID=3117730 RepID=UPI002F26B2CD
MTDRPKPVKQVKPSISDRMVTQLVKVFGPAQISRMGDPRPAAADPLAGLGGEWEMRRGSDGRSFLVRADEQRPASPGDPAPSPDSPHRGDGDTPAA